MLIFLKPLEIFLYVRVNMEQSQIQLVDQIEAYIIPRLSMGSPITLKICPRVASPTGHRQTRDNLAN